MTVQDDLPEPASDLDERAARRRRAHAVPVEYPSGYVVHLIPVAAGLMANRTACGRSIAAAAPATSHWRRVCAWCDRALDSGCER